MNASITLMKDARKLAILKPHRAHSLWNAMEYRWACLAPPRPRAQMTTAIRDSIYPEGKERWFPV